MVQSIIDFPRWERHGISLARDLRYSSMKARAREYVYPASGKTRAFVAFASRNFAGERRAAIKQEIPPTRFAAIYRPIRTRAAGARNIHVSGEQFREKLGLSRLNVSEEAPRYSSRDLQKRRRRSSALAPPLVFFFPAQSRNCL